MDFQIFKTPTKITLGSVSETVKAISYHDCPLPKISSFSAVLLKFSPASVDTYTPWNAFCPVYVPSPLSYADNTYTMLGAAGVVSNTIRFESFGILSIVAKLSPLSLER